MSSETLQGTLISSVHGRDRRAQRNIQKKDLLAAVKYGKKERGYPCRVTGQTRWKYTFANIVYITDETSKREITSYVLPMTLQKVALSAQDVMGHAMLKKSLARDPQLCTSHTVLVIDQSGSMKTSDIDNFRTRSHAAYGTVALDFLGKQIDSGHVTGTDVVSLIEMSDDATVIFEREPITNVLYNMLLDRMNSCTPRSHGNYVPALMRARSILNPDRSNKKCALLLLFLSDGKPSDHSTFIQTAQESILDNVRLLARLYGKQLTLGTVGFAGAANDFQVLSEMAKIATDEGAMGLFQRSEHCSAALGTAITNLRTRLNASIIRLSLLDSVDRQALLRDVELEDFSKDISTLSKDGWKFLLDGHRKATWSPNSQQWVYSRLDCDGLAIRKNIFGQGAERIVFQIAEIFRRRDGRGYYFKDPKNLLVAKESREVKDEYRKVDFHKVFCVTQSHASIYAVHFNNELKKFKRANEKPIPQIKFLDCSVYCAIDPKPRDRLFERGYLVEKMLDNTFYTKWNGNDGTTMDDGMNLLNQVMSKLSIKGSVNDQETFQLNGKSIKVRSIPQAFSHYTYRKSNRKMLVCDLQGVLDLNAQPAPVFELTDPAIHYVSSGSSKHVYGRADHGRSGIHRFFESHVCNEVCKILGLPQDH